ncbi:glycosyltransferase [Paenibacillus glycanilyticus]|uniref:glycosyltransferase family 2 protein n=1 Tax=Paenibacillus glycanilyticus TaxID=126569 RepID=UPI0020411F47|nr:glycosyltransferase [Paenibacillus glycanilyticus]MCM3628005.1 glycosyltransferase [Paenibacillus glycanilyticus]
MEEEGSGRMDDTADGQREALSEEKLPLSLCMIVRDEELFLPSCLASAAPYCSEIIVADTGSTDRTTAIAEAYGAKVLRIGWRDDFAEARNASIERASQPWILVLDADERLLPLPMEEWRRLLAAKDCHGYLITVRSRLDGRNGDEEITDAVCRLFRSDPRIRFAGAIHEETAAAVAACGAGALREAPVEVLHEGYRNAVMLKRRKNERNERILLAALRRDPDNPMLQYAMGTEYFTYGSWEQAVRWLEPVLRGQLEVAGGGEEAGYLSDVWLKLVHALRALGRLEEAEHYARSGLMRYGDFPDLHEACAVVQLEMDRPVDAAQSLKTALLAGPAPVHYSSASGSGGFRTLYAAGYAAERSYDWAYAAEAYAAALALNPAYRPAWERLLMLGALDASLRGFWAAAADHAASGGNHRLCRSMLELLADAGLQLEPAVSSRLIAGLSVGGELWSGLLAVQQGDPAAARQRWARLPEEYPGKGEYLAALARVEGGRAEPPPAGLAHALIRVRAWPAWLGLRPAAAASMAAPVPAPLQWCALLGAAPPVPALAAAQWLCAAAQPGTPARLAAGALLGAAGDWPAAAVQFAAAREAAAQPWVARAAASGLAAALAARARRAAPEAALAAPLLCERELMLRVTSALYGM